MAYEQGEDEFALIARHFAPLASHPAARGLLDDAALAPALGDLVCTTDAIVEGVHFLPDDPLDLVARKALRVNASDLAAKGAAPRFYMLTLLWPDARPADEIGVLARGLREDHEALDVALIGGDTTRTPGPLAISVAMFGTPLGAVPARAGARVGEDIWVSGSIGDAFLGLLARRGEADGLSVPEQAFVIRRYQLPQPRMALAPLVASHASASCDVSDGLLGDAGKIAAASGVGVDLRLDAIPLSAAARAWSGSDEARLARLVTGGDDYEILFTAPASARAGLAAAAAGLGEPITRIGEVTREAGARLIGASGPIALPVGGHVHRLGLRR